MHRIKIVWIFLLAVCLIGLMGGNASLMASHATHFVSDKGPGLPTNETGCSVCHAEGQLQCQGQPLFADMNFFAVTHVCDDCHSPGGAFDGVDDPVIGAKPNWDNGVYNGNTLKSGKEQWCVGCHDDDPVTAETNESAVIDGIYAPGIAGDNVDYGFYYNGHGRADSVECLDCHDATVTHTDGEARTYAFDSAYYGPDQSGDAYAEGYRLKYIGGQVPLMIPAVYNITFGFDSGLMRDTAFRLCFSCHNKNKIFDDTPGDGIYSNFKAS